MNDKLLYRIPEVVEILNIGRSKVYELLHPTRRTVVRRQRRLSRNGAAGFYPF